MHDQRSYSVARVLANLAGAGHPAATCLLAAEAVLGHRAVEEVRLHGLIDAVIALAVTGVPLAHAGYQHPGGELIGEGDRPLVGRGRIPRCADDHDRRSSLGRDRAARTGGRVWPDLADVDA